MFTSGLERMCLPVRQMMIRADLDRSSIMVEYHDALRRCRPLRRMSSRCSTILEAQTLHKPRPRQPIHGSDRGKFRLNREYLKGSFKEPSPSPPPREEAWLRAPCHPIREKDYANCTERWQGGKEGNQSEESVFPNERKRPHSRNL